MAAGGLRRHSKPIPIPDSDPLYYLLNHRGRPNYEPFGEIEPRLNGECGQDVEMTSRNSQRTSQQHDDDRCSLGRVSSAGKHVSEPVTRMNIFARSSQIEEQGYRYFQEKQNTYLMYYAKS